jgi:phosphoglycerate dehydrogenase-like enzyme
VTDPTSAAPGLGRPKEQRPRILCVTGRPGGLDPAQVERLAAAVPEADIATTDPESPLGPDVEADGIITPASAPVLRALETPIPWVHLWGTGVERLPRRVFEGRTVTCSRGASAVPIAEFVLATMLAFEKRLPESWVDRPPKQWYHAELGGLHSRTLAVFGFGHIGGAVAALAQAFGMSVRASRRHFTSDSGPGVAMFPDARDLVAGAHHVLISAPATDATYHAFNDSVFDAMSQGVHLVNIARGSLIDQDALRRALDSGRVARASLDTTDPEPPPAGHWLFTHPSVRLSPHISWSSPAVHAGILEKCIDNVRALAEGRPLAGIVDPTEGY